MENVSKAVAVGVIALAGMLWAGDPYVEGTGAQAVVTDRFVGPNTKIVCDFAFTSPTPVQQRVFGADKEGVADNLSCSVYINGGSGYSWAFQDGNGNWTPFSNNNEMKASTDRWTVTLDSPGNAAVLSNATTTLSQTIGTKRTKTSVLPMTLMATVLDAAGTSFQNYGKVRIYKFELYENGELKLDLVPRKRQGKGVFYDTVSRRMFRSVTSTPLVAGADCVELSDSELAYSGDLVLSDVAGGSYTVNANATYQDLIFTADAGAYTVSGGPIALDGRIYNRSAVAQSVTAPISHVSRLLASVGPGLSLSDVTANGAFIPMGTGGPVTLLGENTFNGNLVLVNNPRVVSPRVYKTSSFSKDLAGKNDANVQVTYALCNDGTTTFTGGLEDYTGGQRGDVVFFEGTGHLVFGGNVQPNGNDGYLVFHSGVAEVASLIWDSDRGYNSALYVESAAVLDCTGDARQTGNYGLHYYVDGTLTIGGTLTLAASYCHLLSPAGTGTLNVNRLVASVLAENVTVPTINVGTGGFVGTDTKVGAVTIGAWTGDFSIGGSPVFSGTTLRAEATNGTPATITLVGTPVSSTTLTKSGSGDLVLPADGYPKLGGTLRVTEGALAFAASPTFGVTVEVADGAGVKVAAGQTATLTAASFAGTATLSFGATPAQVGRLVLPANAFASAEKIVVKIEGTAPAAGTTATLVSGMNLSSDDLAKFELVLPTGATGALAVSNGDLVLSVQSSSTPAASTLVWSGSASTLWDMTAANWLKNGAAAAFTAFDNVRFDGTDAGNGTVVVAEGGVSAGTVTFDANNKTYAVRGGKISGVDAFTVKGGATVVLSAPLDNQPIVVTNGLLRVDAENADLLGSVGAYVEVRDGGTFDIHARSTSEDSILTTHNKKFRIAGAGFKGVGAINNMGTDGGDVARIHTIELTGDATIASDKRWDLRSYANSRNAGRPQLTGTNHVLTVDGRENGGSFCLIGADVNLGKMVVDGNGTVSVESGTAFSAKDGVELQKGYLQFWNIGRNFETPIFVSGTGRIGTGGSMATVAGPIRVETGATLSFTGGSGKGVAMKYAGGIGGDGALRVTGDVHHFVSDVEQENLAVTGGFAVYGDATAAGNARKWPKNVAMSGGYLCFAPSTNSVYRGYTLTSTGDKISQFVPGWTDGAATTGTVVTVEDTTLGDGVGVSLGLGGTNSYVRRSGFATFGRGFTANALATLSLGTFLEYPGDATLTISDGASVTMKAGANVTLGLYSGETNNLHRLVVDGGVFDATAANPVRVGYDTHAAEFLVKGGTAKLSGVALRANNKHGMKPLAMLSRSLPYEVFGMSGGNVELYGDLTTERAYPMVPQFWFGGGTLTSVADWSTDHFQYGMFEPWGDISGTNVFTLATNGKKATFRSALQGNSKVELTGDGSFVADYHGVQGGVEGRWTVANTGTATLKTAAAFADGLAVTNGATAMIDIGPRTNYVGMSVLCNVTNEFGANPMTVDNFYSSASVFPSLFTKDMQKLFCELTTPHYMAYRADAEFYVDEAGTWTFAVTYDDRGDVLVDGRRVAYNSAWNNVGVGSIDLTKGWHRVSITCKDNSGGAGPAKDYADPKSFYDRGMAVGFHKGATTSTDGVDYLPFSPAHLTMRPVRSVRWTYRDGVKTQNLLKGWPETEYAFTMVTNSMQAIHDKNWHFGKTAVNSFAGWLYVTPEEAGTWAFDGVYDDRIYVEIDGKKAFANGSYNKTASSTAEVSAGWHAFRVSVCDYGGGISWSAVDNFGAALYVKRPSDAARVTFDERNLYMTAYPFGFIGGNLDVAEGATLANVSANGPAEITGTLSGTGTLTGPYRLTGTWNVSVEDGRTLKAATWGDGADANTLADAKIHVSMNAKPVKAQWTLGPALGLEGKTEAERAAMLTADLNGEPYENGFKLAVVDGKLMLVNLKPGCTVIILR